MPEPEKSHRYRAYREAWQRRSEEADRLREQRRRQALDTAVRCSQILIQRFGARRVYVFGSVVDPERFHEGSDLDLAVEGLPVDRTYWRALVDLWAELPNGIKLDLVPLEEASPALASRIQAEGELLKAS
jgi:uncharacterized protein